MHPTRNVLFEITNKNIRSTFEQETSTTAFDGFIGFNLENLVLRLCISKAEALVRTASRLHVLFKIQVHPCTSWKFGKTLLMVAMLEV